MIFVRMRASGVRSAVQYSCVLSAYRILCAKSLLISCVNENINIMLSTPRLMRINYENERGIDANADKFAFGSIRGAANGLKNCLRCNSLIFGMERNQNLFGCCLVRLFVSCFELWSSAD